MPEETTPSIPEMVDEVRAGKLPRRRFVKVLSAMGISAAGVGAIAAAASRSSSSKSAAPVQPHAQPDTHIQLHQEHVAHQSKGNKDALQEDYAPHAVVEDSMYPEPFVGQEAIMARKGTGMAAISDLQITITNRVAHGNQVSAEWIASGTHSGDLPGMPATGRPFTLVVVPVSICEQRKMVWESIYSEVGGLGLQVGSASAR